MPFACPFELALDDASISPVGSPGRPGTGVSSPDDSSVWTGRSSGLGSATSNSGACTRVVRPRSATLSWSKVRLPSPSVPTETLPFANRLRASATADCAERRLLPEASDTLRPRFVTGTSGTSSDDELSTRFPSVVAAFECRDGVGDGGAPPNSRNSFCGRDRGQRVACRRQRRESVLGPACWAARAWTTSAAHFHWSKASSASCQSPASRSRREERAEQQPRSGTSDRMAAVGLGLANALWPFRFRICPSSCTCTGNLTLRCAP